MPSNMISNLFSTDKIRAIIIIVNIYQTYQNMCDFHTIFTAHNMRNKNIIFCLINFFANMKISSSTLKNKAIKIHQ